MFSKVLIKKEKSIILHLNNKYHLVKIYYNKEIQALIIMLNVLTQQTVNTQ